MRIYIPSYHKNDRKISPLLNRPETIFIVRPLQEEWYKQNFPKAQIKAVVADLAPVGNPGLVIARQIILDDWRSNAPENEIFAWMLDDDWKGFTFNDNGTKRKITIDEAYEILISKADKDTRIIGPTNSNMEMAFNPEIVRTNKGEAPESVYLFSKFCKGKYRTLTFESQYFAAKQIETGGNFKTVHAIQLDYYNDQKISTIFNISEYVKLSKELCDNTVEEFPNLFKIIVGKQGTYKVKFKEQKYKNMGFKF
jgi:hypothetical protein